MILLHWCPGLFLLLAFLPAVPSPILFPPPKYLAHCPPAAWISGTLGAPEWVHPEGRDAQQCPAVLRIQETLLNVVCGGQASRVHFFLSLGGYSKSTPGKGKVTMPETDLQMGHVHIYTFTKAAASPQLLSQAIASLW